MTEAEKYQRIEDYLAGKLPPEEVASFELEMKKDSQLAKEVQLHRGLVEAVQEEEEIDSLRAKMKAVMEPEQPKARSPYRLIILIVLLLLIVSSLFYFLNQKGGTQQIFADRYIDYPEMIYGPVNLRSINPSITPQANLKDQLDSLWQLANQSYQASRYQQALIFIDQIRELEYSNYNQNSSEFYFFKGIVLARQNKIPDAIRALQLVENEYDKEADWKRAILMLSLDQANPEAIQLLKQIRTAESPRSQKAAQLLDELSAR